MTEVAVSDERKNFSKIRSFMDLPNLIDVQRRSYERFLQMNLLPEERDQSGLQAVFTSVFPFADFRGACELQFVKYAIGNWECKCGRLKGLEHLRMDCRTCGARIVTAHPHEEIVSCDKCGAQNPNKVTLCDVCGNPVDLQMKYSVAECQERGMTYSVPAQGHLPPLRLRQGPGDGRQDDAGRQGRGGLLRRHPADDRARHVRHQRHRARHRLPAPPLARRLLHEGVGARVPRQDHPVPRLVGGVRVRPEGRPLRPHRPQAQVPGDDLPAGPGPGDRRVDPAAVLRRRCRRASSAAART